MDSLTLFIQKLQNKNQSVEQQNQAKQAVSLFFEIRTSSDQPLVVNNSAQIPLEQSVNHTKVMPGHGKSFNNDATVAQNSRQQSSSIQPKLNSLTTKLLEETGTSWVFVFDQLVNEIKIRHYSPKTLKAYRGYIRQFQAFTKSKDYQKLSQQDVIDFFNISSCRKTSLCC